MPHLIIEHSSDIKSSSIKELEKGIQNIMNFSQGNFDSDQCKCRSYSFEKYLVGHLDEENSSFIHITLKILFGRSIEIRKDLSKKVDDFTKKFISGSGLKTKRCDISIDIVEMEKATYQKSRI